MKRNKKRKMKRKWKEKRKEKRKGKREGKGMRKEKRKMKRKEKRKRKRKGRGRVPECSDGFFAFLRITCVHSVSMTDNTCHAERGCEIVSGREDGENERARENEGKKKSGSCMYI